MKVRAAAFETAAARPQDFPAAGAAEVAFLGRSNVGKSSLLNRLVKRRALAHTSSTPGKTRLLNWFRIECDGRTLRFVDLPGYGYAKVAKAERQRWQKLVEAYLAGREPLRLAVLLQDLRRDVSEDETLLVEWLEERGVPVLLALTKCDKLKPMRRAARVKLLRGQLGLPAERVVATSAQTGLGMPELWHAIASFL